MVMGDHIPEWRKVIAHIFRILRDGGEFYVTEPNFKHFERWHKKWDKTMKWDHPFVFSFDEMEEYIRTNNFMITGRKISFFSLFGYVGCRKNKKKNLKAVS